mmetsp:Transcript_27553/g.45385  ORF Transcript_27553/g.45385 Transcript_27553/m.45385 type:complete len:263 (-) Transcript_27553:413-1201(-)
MTLILKQRLKQHHMDLLQQLDREYEQRVVDLMRQKQQISMQMMEEYYQLMLAIETDLHHHNRRPSLHSATATALPTVESIPMPSLDTDPYNSKNTNNDVGTDDQDESSAQPYVANATPGGGAHPAQNGQNETMENYEPGQTAEADLKPHKCRYCDYRSAIRCHITRHERIHTGEKPYRCRWCEYRSARKDNLQAHEKTHTRIRSKSNNKPKHTNKASDMSLQSDARGSAMLFKCEYCDYRAVCKSALTRHEKGHIAQKTTKK